VPETLLKKRKSQEAARATRRADAEKTKQVSQIIFNLFLVGRGSGLVMITTHTRLDICQCCRFY
jgi:hypothetical protein